MGKKKDIMTNIADLLPEGLDENLLEQIAELLDKKIKEEVNSQVENLNTKVRAFIRGKVEKLKEQALKELELENETFRDAEMFKTMKSMFALENTSEDEVNGFRAIAEISESQERKLDTLVAETERLLKENVQMKRSIKLLNEQNSRLKENAVSLNENLKLASKTQTKKMSDRSMIVSAESFNKVEKAKAEKTVGKNDLNENEWITPDTLDTFKKLKLIG